MPLIDIIDEAFVVADPEELAARVHDPQLWRRWWPHLELTIFMDRGVDGIRWTATGELVGSVELWLEPYADGVIVHHYVRADPARSTDPKVANRMRLAHTLAWKRSLNALKDEMERGRPVGAPRVASVVKGSVVKGSVVKGSVVKGSGAPAED